MQDQADHEAAPVMRGYELEMRDDECDECLESCAEVHDDAICEHECGCR